MIRCWLGLHDWRAAVRTLGASSRATIDVLECRRDGCDATRLNL